MAYVLIPMMAGFAILSQPAGLAKEKPPGRLAGTGIVYSAKTLTCGKMKPLP